MLLRGETTWPALAAIAATCFDALHDTPSWNEDDDQGAAIEAFNDALDARSPRWPAGRGPATAPTPRPAWWSLASSSGCSPDCSATRTPSVTGRTAGGSGMPTPPDRSASRSAGAVRPVGLRLTWHRHGGGLPDGEPGTVAVAGRELPGVLPAGIPAATLSRWAATTPTATPACRRRSPTWPPPAGRAPTPPSRTPHTRRDSAVRSTDTDRDHPAVPTLEPPTCRPGEQDHFRSTFQLGDVVRMPDGALGRITAFDTTWSHVRAGRIVHAEPVLASLAPAPPNARLYGHDACWEHHLAAAQPGDVAAHMALCDGYQWGQVNCWRHVPATRDRPPTATASTTHPPPGARPAGSRHDDGGDEPVRRA